jgi:hypothetical protein
MIAGSFLIYCCNGGGGAGGPGDGSRGDGLVGDAHGDTGCCNLMPQTFTKIADGTLSTEYSLTNAIDVSAYREVVLYGDYCDFRVLFQPDASSPFGFTGQGGNVFEGGRIRVDGPALKLEMWSPTSSAPCRYQLAGVH